MTHIISGTVLIWISQWEYQCCGTPITAGEVVDLTVHASDWAAPWEQALGGAILLVAEHHVPPDDSWHLRVHVDRLFEARGHRAQHPPDDTWHLAPDSGEVCEVAAMKVWDKDWQPARAGGQPEGWILGASILDELPPHPDGIPYGLDPKPRSARRNVR